MKTLTLFALALLMAACSGCDEREESGDVVRCEITPSAEVPGYYLFRVRLPMPARTVQEVSIAGADVPIRCIDYFDAAQDDVHVGAVGETRTMRAYRADVYGSSPVNGFALLSGTLTGFTPINDDRLNIGIAAQGSVAVEYETVHHWSIEAMSDGVRVTIDGRVKWFPK
jgi:hypothetical protein